MRRRRAESEADLTHGGRSGEDSQRGGPARPAARLLAVCVAALLLFGFLGAASPGAGVSAATKKYKVTLTIRMGKEGSSCPELRFEKDGKTYIAQAVKEWRIDGKRVKDPWSMFYGGAWKFKDHEVTVVMSRKLSKGAYKVSVDNGAKVKSLGTIRVRSGPVKKTIKFA
jgi:hypothetical protein